MKLKSIKSKLLITFLPYFLIFFSIICGISTYTAQKAIKTSMDETSAAIANDYASRVRAYVRESLVQQEDFAGMPQLRLADNQSQIAEALAGIKEQLKILESAVFIYPDGFAVRSDGTTVELGDRDYFKKVSEIKETVVSELMVSRTTGKTAFNVASPVMNNGQFVGVLTGSFAIENLTSLISDLKFMDTGYGIIADETGVVLADPDLPESVGKLNLTEKKIPPELGLSNSELDGRLISLFSESAKTGKQLKGIYTSPEGITKAGTFTPIELPGDRRWVMLVSVPLSEANRPVEEMSTVMLAASISCLILAVIILVILSGRIAKPISDLRGICARMANGDLSDSGASFHGNDEIGQAKKSLQEMRTSLRLLIQNVLSRSEQVAASSQELTAISQQSAESAGQVADSIAQIADGARSQASSAEHLTGVSSEMSLKAEHISRASKDASHIALTTSQVAEHGNNAVQQAIAQMEEIGRGSAEIRSAVDALSKGSDKINEIVSLISSISAQTNLLALNASIEAARAGEHGHGFAVVAEEIRKLAEESNNSAKQIGSLIKTNRDNMQKAVDAAVSGNEGVRTGISLVYSTGETFKKIVEDVLQVSQMIEGVSSSIGQMVQGNHSLASSIVQISHVSKRVAEESQTVSAATEEQAASMQEMAAASQGLSSLAAELQAAAAKFLI